MPRHFLALLPDCDGDTGCDGDNSITGINGSDLPCFFAFLNPGPQEMLIVGIIALLMFGKRLPEAARRVDQQVSEARYRLAEMQHPELIAGLLIGSLVIVLQVLFLARLFSLH